MIKNYYDILGLDKNASNQEIKKAYRKLAMKFHPDKNQGGKYFEAKFKDINEAHEILTDRTKKQEFDIELNKYSTNNKSHKNHLPIIEYFEVSPSEIRYGEKITVKWKCINADIIEIKPFGFIENHEGQKFFKLYSFENKKIEIKLIARDSNTKREVSKSKKLINKTYIRLKDKFIKEFLAEEKVKIEKAERIKEEKQKLFEERYKVQKINLINGQIMKIIISSQNEEVKLIRIDEKLAEDGFYRLHDNFKAYEIKNHKIIKEYILSTEKQKNGKSLTVGKHLDTNKTKGSPVWLDNEIAPDGVYKYGFLGKIRVSNGIVQK